MTPFILKPIKQEKEMTHNLQYFKDKNKKWRFRFVARNGRILCSSEAYSSLTKAKQGSINLVRAIQNRTLEICD